MKIAVLGAGAWGTALARLLQESGTNAVTLWAHEPARLEQIAQAHTNELYLPGITLPTEWTLEPNLAKAVANCECIVVAVPSKAFREVTGALREFRGLVVSVTKGIEYETGLTMSGVLCQTAPGASVAALVPLAFIIVLAIWIVMFALTRYVSVASIAGAVALPFAAYFTNNSGTIVLVTAFMAALAVYKHRSNIQRLLNGTESRFVRKPKEQHP